ncbi:unnamed protein product [Hymenolepis diminuta]|uniref:PDZ domain-containing protein n=1 Tax=Hymenolepis diminuta TaxID=6216 RepID=A0A0R3S954_HYMDI|nr:unnamed protein product [Hymenolepis diminuta]
MPVGELQKYKLWRARTSDAWGFKITTCDNKTFITGVYTDTPAEKAGVALNEIILTINRTPCDNVPHEYVYHVIRKIDNNMSLVTRKATPEEVQMVNVMARERYYEDGTADRDISSSKENIETERKPKSAETNGELGHKDEEKRKESNFPHSKKKNRNSSAVVANENHSNKHRHHDRDGKGEYNKEDIQKASDSHKRPTRTLENYHVNGVEEDRKEKSRKSRVVDKEDKSPRQRRESHTTYRQSTTKPVSGVETAKPAKIESDDDRKSEVRMRKTSEVFPSERKTAQVTKSKSTIGLDTTESDYTEREDAEAVKEDKKSFPSVGEIRANLQAGKRRTLLLSRGDSFEERVDLLNNL